MTVPSHARVVVIGGGIAGCSIAYHLAELGWNDIVLVEGNTLSSGTTWHSAGDLPTTSYALSEFIRDSIALYPAISRETEQEIGWKHCGTILTVSTEDRMINQRRMAALWRSIGGTAGVVTPREIAQIDPFVRTDDLIGGVYSPDAYRVNPTDLVQAFAKAMRARGVKIIENVRVTDFEYKTSSGLPTVSAVVTEGGRIDCETFVLASGAWSHELGKRAGISVPLQAVHHSYLITEEVAGANDKLPITRDYDSWIYSREEVGGFLVGFFEPGSRILSREQMSNDSPFAMLPEDWDHLGPYIERAAHRFPYLESAGIKTVFTGPESFTPDGHFLIGEAPGLRGAFVLTGFNSCGIMFSGGAGKALAEWMDVGEATFDASHFDIRRFPAVLNDTAWLEKRITEIPSWGLRVTYPFTEYETGRNLLLTPFHDRLIEKGACFGQRAGWERPNWYDPKKCADESPTFGQPGWFHVVAEEHRAARESVALNASFLMGTLAVEGSGAQHLLQHLCANNVDVKIGRLVYTPILNERGGFESDVTVTRLGEDRYLLVTGIAEIGRDYDHVMRFAANREDVSVTNTSSAYAALALSGPNSRALLSRVTDDDLSNTVFPYFSGRAIRIGPTEVLALRVSFTGELGWELLIPVDDALLVYDALWAAEMTSSLGLRSIGTYAVNGLRLEKGFRAWGSDLNPVTTPWEAGLDFAVQFEKEIPFVGRDALLRQRDEGWQKQLVAFTLKDPSAFPFADEPIWRDGKYVGNVSSAGFGYSIDRMIAMGYVRHNGQRIEHDYILSGNYEIEIADRKCSATPHLTPLFDDKGARPRA